MKALFRITLLAMATLFAFTACEESEEEITPSGDYSPIRGGFPQGDSEYDKILLDIKNQYGVYLLYKDVSEEDMNRTWVSAGTGDIYVAGDSADRNKRSWDLPTIQLPLYVDFFNDYIFPNIDTTLAKKTFQNYLQDEKQPGVTSEACVDCGYCESKCPQHLSIRQLLKKAEARLESL